MKYMSQLLKDVKAALFFKNGAGNTSAADLRLKAIFALLMGFASLLLTILNIVKQYWFMTGTTTLLVIGFFTSAFLCGKLKMKRFSVMLMALMVAIVFSVYAVTGQNEGFAILWILLVPPIGTFVLGLEAGIALCGYFQVFLVTIFYTPLYEFTDASTLGVYTETFRIRFPLLFLTCFIASVLLMVQKIYYAYKAEMMAYTDALTGLKNRRYYEEITAKFTSQVGGRDTSLIMVDINRLKYTNDELGHAAGDELIVTTAEFLSRYFPESDVTARMGGDEFSILTPLYENEIKERLKKMKAEMAEFRGEYIQSPSVSVGVASSRFGSAEDLDRLEKEADAEMYEEKKRFYERSTLERRKR